MLPSGYVVTHQNVTVVQRSGHVVWPLGHWKGTEQGKGQGGVNLRSLINLRYEVLLFILNLYFILIEN